MKDIFLCHTGVDKEWVRYLGERLETERIEGRPVKVWFDEWDIDYGEQIIAKIDEGLRASRFVGVVLSPAAARASWPNAEWQSQIMADPVNKGGRIIPILRHKYDPETGAPIDLPFALRPLKWFDFTSDRQFDTELARLLRRLSNERPTRGAGRGGLGSARASVAATGRDSADSVEESLPSNLFPVLSLPEYLYGDETPARMKRDVWNALTGKRVPPFALHGTRLYSFYRPDAAENPFRPVLAVARPSAESVREWLEDPDRSRLVVGMLNAALREHCYHLRIRSPKNDRAHFYCPMFDGEPRMFRWGIRGRERTLAKMKARPNGTTFGVHMSAKLRFTTIAGRIFLVVEPGWLFTSDGATPLEGPDVGRFSTKWNGPERNATVLRNVLMWGLLLSKGSSRIEIEVGPGHAVVQSVPVHTQVKAGLDGDVIRLDRILGGEGAGERVAGVREDADGDSEGGVVDELDRMADLALVGALPYDDPRDAQAHLADDGEHLEESAEAASEDVEPVDVRVESRLASGRSDTLELPF